MWTWAEMPPSQRERWEKIALAAAPAAPQAAGVGETLEAAESIHAAAIIYEDQALLDDAEVVLNHLGAPSREPEGGAMKALAAIRALVEQSGPVPKGEIRSILNSLATREEAPAGSGIAYMAGLLARAVVEAGEEAPAEAGEAARIIACHLPLGDAPDTVCLPITMTAGDLRTVYAALCAQPQAREDAEADVTIEVTEHQHPVLGSYGSITGWTNHARLPAGRYALYTNPPESEPEK